MNVTEARHVTRLLEHLTGPGLPGLLADPPALAAARELAERTTKVLQSTGNAYVRPDRFPAATAVDGEPAAARTVAVGARAGGL